MAEITVRDGEGGQRDVPQGTTHARPPAPPAAVTRLVSCFCPRPYSYPGDPSNPQPERGPAPRSGLTASHVTPKKSPGTHGSLKALPGLASVASLSSCPAARLFIRSRPVGWPLPSLTPAGPLRYLTASAPAIVTAWDTLPPTRSGLAPSLT